ncbi:hypothetical protein TIFTF001_044203 [Ficus carica]|uniref:Uncharacterized protein n=1 Tax=Ficus carica TaxID=3494 RepID=A0AA88CN91_FICCA|nr:hypothetical protein TIFTF001_044199 [Ficus carica]GMN28163.1 hypothetical protein TIFTF001_044203 [Ficus carica]
MVFGLPDGGYGDGRRADGGPVYNVDYFTSAITPEFLDSLQEEFQSPRNVELVVPGPNNLPSRPPPGHASTPEAERCPNAAERQCLSDLDKLLCSLGKVQLQGVVIQRLSESLPDEDSSFVVRVVLFSGLPGNVHRRLPELRQELQALMVLPDGHVVVWSGGLQPVALRGASPHHIQKGLCVDKGTAHGIHKPGKDREAPGEAGP